MKEGFLFGGAFLPDEVVNNFPKQDNITKRVKEAVNTFHEIEAKYGNFLARTWFDNENSDLMERLEDIERAEKPGPLYITRVLYNYPTTVVFWNDNTKTSVRCSDKDAYCKEAGLSMCVLKKLIGTASFKNLFEDWMPEQYYDDLGDENAEVRMKDVRYKHNHQD